MDVCDRKASSCGQGEGPDLARSAAQGMPVLAAMVEDDLSDGGAMTRAGLACTWRLLELHGPPALNSLCRLLAAAGLAPRLVAALGAAAAALAPAQPVRPLQHKCSGGCACAQWGCHATLE